MCTFPCTVYKGCGHQVDEEAKQCAVSAGGNACSNFRNKASYEEGVCPDCKGKQQNEGGK